MQLFFHSLREWSQPELPLSPACRLDELGHKEDVAGTLRPRMRAARPCSGHPCLPWGELPFSARIS